MLDLRIKPITEIYSPFGISFVKKAARPDPKYYEIVRQRPNDFLVYMQHTLNKQQIVQA